MGFGFTLESQVIMTAETHLVPLELPDLSHNNSPTSATTIATSSPSKVPSLHIQADPESAPFPNCNGANGIHHHHHDGDDHDDDAIPKYDAGDNSYTFVTRNDDSPLPLDMNHHLNGTAHVQSCHSNLIDLQIAKLAAETDANQVASSINGVSVLHQEGSVVASVVGDAFLVGGPSTAASEVVLQNGGGAGGAKADAEPCQLADCQIDSKLPSPAPRENQESDVAVFHLQADADLVESRQAQYPSLHVAKPTDGCQKSEGNDFDLISPLQEEIQEFQHGSLESSPPKSPEFEVSKPIPTNQFHSESSDRVSGAQDPENGQSDASQFVPHQTELQEANLEDQIGIDSTNVIEERVQSGVLVKSKENSETSEFHKSGQRDEGEETKMELLSEDNQNPESIVGSGKNGEPSFDQELEAVNSPNDVDLLSVTASGPVSNESKDHFPVSSSNCSVPDNKESYESTDDSEIHSKESNNRAVDGEKSLELLQFATDADTLVPATSCVKTDTVGNPVESIENVQDAAKEQEVQHEIFPSTENVTSRDDGVCKPETEDIDNAGAQSIAEVPDISRQHEIEKVACSSCEHVVGEDKVIKSETEVASAISLPISDSILEIIQSKGVNNDDLVGVVSILPNTTISGSEFQLGTDNSKEKMQSFQVENMHLKPEVGVLDDECGDMRSVSSVEEVKDEVENSSGTDGADMACSNSVASNAEVSDSSVVISESAPNLGPEFKDVEAQEDKLSLLDVKIDNKLICQERKNMEKSHENEISTSLSENSNPDALAGQNVGFGPLTRSFCYLIRMPRFDDLKIREQIQLAQLQVEEKTKHRDAFRLEIQKHKANCQSHAAEYEDALSKARASKRSVKSKRAEIDSIQSVINKVKNAISVEDIDARIYSMEHMIQHETLPLKEEKQFIREIKQLKQLREQLSSNIGSQDEVQQALKKRDEFEERLKILKKELDNLKDGVLKAETVARAAQKKYEDESLKLRELISQVEDANDIRQAAYHHLQSLKKELFEKNKQFRTYKDNAAAASDYAARKDREALHHLCVNQVETVMDLWNKDDAFRKEYVKCNMRSTLRRLGTLDGRSLGPDEEPPEMMSYRVERIDRFVLNPSNTSAVLQTQDLIQENQLKYVEDVCPGDRSKIKEVRVNSEKAESREAVKPFLRNGLATISGRMISDVEITEKERIPTMEEQELARKAEELTKAEAAAKLREQRRLEEKAKALEALERKKRIAEKAQMRAELRAQKEAELREKEREKRLRKKERKRAGGAEVPDGNNIGECTPKSEIVPGTMKESEVKYCFPTVTKRSQNPSVVVKQSKTKSIPPPLRNRGKRKIQQWMWIILTCVVVIALFLLGNIGFFSSLSNFRPRSHSF